MTVGLEGCGYTRTLGMKRVRVSKKASPLEALPKDVLVKVLCRVDHEDLKQLFHVSNTIREVTLIAKKLHFQFNTPKKNIFVILNPSADELWEIEPPNAPLIRRKSKSRFFRNKLEDISVDLFAFMNEEQ